VIRSQLRRSNKLRRCDCGTLIQPGDQYLQQVISPHHGEVGNVGWWRADECRACAVRYDRWPIPNGAVEQR
jgi:hypothetical protein